jgi:hypothetical protein
MAIERRRRGIILGFFQLPEAPVGKIRCLEKRGAFRAQIEFRLSHQYRDAGNDGVRPAAIQAMQADIGGTEPALAMKAAPHAIARVAVTPVHFRELLQLAYPALAAAKAGCGDSHQTFW